MNKKKTEEAENHYIPSEPKPLKTGEKKTDRTLVQIKS